MLRCEGLTQTYLSGGRVLTVLKDITFTLEDSGFLAIVGPSGSGKTTLLGLLAGLDRPSRGNVFLDGADLGGMTEDQRARVRGEKVGFVFQSFQLIPTLTALENVQVPLELSGRAADVRPRELLARVGLAERSHHYPAQLSGGEQQRVALARALAPAPALLLLDEPLSALDARVRQSLRHEIRGLQRRLGVTTIMVTHDQEEALAMADRIVVMNAGQVEQVGGPAEVYRRPQTPFVARFVGQMNFLSGIASSRSGWARVGDLELRHQPGFEASPGSAVTLAIRPEEIAVGPAARGAVNSLTARIAGLQFLGPFTRLALAPVVTGGGDGQAALECDVAATAFSELGVGEGALVPIALDPQALRAFRAAGGAP